MKIFMMSLFFIFILNKVCFANIDLEKKVFNKCIRCHSYEKGAPHMMGPNLWNVYNQEVAKKKDYKYSKALLKLKSKNGKWDDKSLKLWLANPKLFLPGNKMYYPGLKKEREIEDVILFLKQFSDK